jgi:hypothetical protein
VPRLVASCLPAAGAPVSGFVNDDDGVCIRLRRSPSLSASLLSSFCSVAEEMRLWMRESCSRAAILAVSTTDAAQGSSAERPPYATA